MFDLHYDLLSILYYSYLKNDFSYVKKIRKYFNDNNVKSVVANLYFMSPEQMKKEIHIKEIDVEEMFRISTKLYYKYFGNFKALFSIEGCDYIKSLDSLERLKKMGLNNILLVWNNKNIYGSGAKSSGGLTEKGKEFLNKAIDLGLTIDLSHMNEETYNDVINFLFDEKN